MHASDIASKTASNRGTLGWILFILAVSVFVFFEFQASLMSAYSLEVSWTAAHSWIASAECARTSGVLLAGCTESGLVPFAAISLADDVGHALFLGVYALLTGTPVTAPHVSMLNTAVNFTGLLLLSGAFVAAGWRKLVPFVLFAGAPVMNDWHAIGPHPTQLGLICFAAILPVCITTFAKHKIGPFMVAIALGSGCLALAILFRQSVGTMGAVASLLTVILVAIVDRDFRKAPLKTAIVLVGIATGLFASDIVLFLRDAVWHLPSTDLIEQHGIQHNLFIGLGAVPNAFGIEWNDAHGLQAARRVNPEVGYVTKEYYQILGSEYLRLVLENPIEVLRIYAHKLQLLLTSPVGGRIWGNVPIYVVLLFWAVPAIVVLAVRSVRQGIRSLTAADRAFGVCALFVVFILAQGAIINQSSQYFAPLRFLFVPIVIYSTWLMIGRLRASTQNFQPPTR